MSDLPPEIFGPDEGTHPAVVVTRAESSNGPLSTHLRRLGLRVLLWPAVSVVAAPMEPLDAALARIQDFDWIVFASRYAVAAVIGRLPSAPANLRVAAIGRATAQVLKQRGWRVDLLPSEANAASLVSAFAAQAEPLAGRKILFPASSRALPTIAAGLRQLGADVLQIEAYRTESSALDVADCRIRIARDSIGAVTFASPSAVIELERSLGKADFDRLLSTATAVAIGPTTARELSERGRPAVLAESASLKGLAVTTFRVLQTRH
ncbi:MAG TPA: uroporphyrinogen-III synthase [Steroidobacteraceae bacterium]|nr:uroporphyrinogen-III synthase [Steroidobacteraceae bacterium]